MYVEDLVAELQLHLIESGGAAGPFSSGLWTTTEVLDHLTHAQMRFLLATGAVLAHVVLPVVPEVGRVVGPDDLMAIRRAAWRSASGTIRELPRGDTWEADHLRASWPTTMSATPSLYAEATARTRELELLPAPMDAGQLDLLYLATGQVLSLTPFGVLPDEFDILSLLRGGWSAPDLTRLALLELREPGALLGTPLLVPDEFGPYIKWGALADLLGKTGRAFDPIRSAYAEERFQEGVLAANLLLASWDPGQVVGG